MQVTIYNIILKDINYSKNQKNISFMSRSIIDENRDIILLDCKSILNKYKPLFYTQ